MVFKKGQRAWNKGKKLEDYPQMGFQKNHEVFGGKKTRFQKNQIPWNKGKKTGLIPKSAFKKGSEGFVGNHSNKSKQKMRESAIGKHDGKKNGCWQGGISFEPYDKRFNNLFKRAIRKRDNQICMLCSIHREKLKESLIVHHVDYNKKLSISQNCLSLCRSCHGKTNANRKHWIKFFQSILSEKYDYQYSEKSEVIIRCPLL